MRSRAADRYLNGHLPPDVHADLVATLFGTVGSFASGLIGGLLVTYLAWSRTGEPNFLICEAVMLAFSALRVVVLFAYLKADPTDRRQRAGSWEKAYAVGGIGFMTCVGTMGALSLDVRSDIVTMLFGVVSVLACAGQLAGRNAGRPQIVMGQAVGLCGPVAVVLLMRFDSWYEGLSFTFVLIVISVWSTTKFLNRMLVSALLSERDARERGLQLGIALDSMTHGLCMAAQDGSLTVINRRLRVAFGLSDVAPPRTLDGLADAIAAAGGMSPEAGRAFATVFRGHVDGLEPRQWTEAIGSRIVLFRSQPMEAGGSVVVVEDITEARRSALKVEYLAHYDALTGLLNRFRFQQDLAAALAESGGSTGLALLGIDLDRFKEVNDTLGHPAGDSLLRQVADRLRDLCGPSATVARFGGDEFQVMLNPSPDAAELDAFAQAAIARISEPYLVEGQAVSIGASIGLATAPKDAVEADDLLRCADMALYGAKGLARGTSLHFSPEMDAQVQLRRQTELELRDALASGQMEVFYQPTVDLRSGRVSTFEALVRWRHPLRGLVPPDSFIPVAEECGLIADLGEFVLRRACEDALGWPSEIRVAVNVSPKQFLLRRDLVQRIAAILADTGLPPARLEVEITESTLLDAKAALAAIAASGVRISLDDFGTGYSSLSYLRLFTIHKIKIDRSFVRIGDRTSLAIIEAVASLAATLEMDLVVEGVETPEQLRSMADRRINLIQGYLFSRPKPLDELAPLLEGRLDTVATMLRAVA